jgi:hypothetical protein
MAIFTVRATQYISGSGPSANLAEFEIIVRHSVHKKNLYERTKKAKLGSRVFLIGELDVHNNKLCIELHNFEFLSANPSPQLTPPLTPSSSTSSTSSSASEKRNHLYNTILETSNTDKPQKRQKSSNPIQNHRQNLEHTTSPPTSSTTVTQTSPKEILINQTTDQVKNQPTKSTNQPKKRTLRSNNKTKKNL